MRAGCRRRAPAPPPDPVRTRLVSLPACRRPGPTLRPRDCRAVRMALASGMFINAARLTEEVQVKLSGAQLACRAGMRLCPAAQRTSHDRRPASMLPASVSASATAALASPPFLPLPACRPGRHGRASVPAGALCGRRCGGGPPAHPPLLSALPLPPPVGVLLLSGAERQRLVRGAGGAFGEAASCAPLVLPCRPPQGAGPSPTPSPAHTRLPAVPTRVQVRDAGRAGHRVGLADRGGGPRVQDGATQPAAAAMRQPARRCRDCRHHGAHPQLWRAPALHPPCPAARCLTHLDISLISFRGQGRSGQAQAVKTARRRGGQRRGTEGFTQAHNENRGRRDSCFAAKMSGAEWAGAVSRRGGAEQVGRRAHGVGFGAAWLRAAGCPGSAVRPAAKRAFKRLTPWRPRRPRGRQSAWCRSRPG